jgi:hypothetical protein
MDTPVPSSPLPPSPAPIPRAAVWASRIFNVLLLSLCALLVALSYYSFTLYCESFGCIGVGLMWMLWAGLAAVGWVVAWGVHAWQRRRGLGARVSGCAWAFVSLVGAGHALYWLGNTVLR